jgi:hypothetical protein
MKMSRICTAGAQWAVEVFLKVKESPMHTYECVWGSGDIITLALDRGEDQLHDLDRFIPGTSVPHIYIGVE